MIQLLLNHAKETITDLKQLESVTESYIKDLSSYVESGQLPLDSEI